MIFLEFSLLSLFYFSYDLMDVRNLISGSSAFSTSSLNIWKFLIHLLLNLSLKDFEHYIPLDSVFMLWLPLTNNTWWNDSMPVPNLIFKRPIIFCFHFVEMQLPCEKVILDYYREKSHMEAKQVLSWQPRSTPSCENEVSLDIQPQLRYHMLRWRQPCE